MKTLRDLRDKRLEHYLLEEAFKKSEKDTVVKAPMDKKDDLEPEVQLDQGGDEQGGSSTTEELTIEEPLRKTAEIDTGPNLEPFNDEQQDQVNPQNAVHDSPIDVVDNPLEEAEVLDDPKPVDETPVEVNEPSPDQDVVPEEADAGLAPEWHKMLIYDGANTAAIAEEMAKTALPQGTALIRIDSIKQKHRKMIQKRRKEKAK